MGLALKPDLEGVDIAPIAFRKISIADTLQRTWYVSVIGNT